MTWLITLLIGLAVGITVGGLLTLRRMPGMLARLTELELKALASEVARRRTRR